MAQPNKKRKLDKVFKGSFGKVHISEDETLATKVIAGNTFNPLEDYSLLHIRNPGLVRSLATTVFEYPNVIFTMNYGGNPLLSLGESIKKFAAKIAVQCLGGAVALKEFGVQHCDLSANNIFVTTINGDVKAQIGDFGSAKYCRPGEIESSTTTYFAATPARLSGMPGSDDDGYAIFASILYVAFYKIFATVPPFLVLFCILGPPSLEHLLTLDAGMQIFCMPMRPLKERQYTSQYLTTVFTDPEQCKVAARALYFDPQFRLPTERAYELLRSLI